MAIVAEILLADRALPLVDLACSIPSNEISISNIVPLEDERLLVAVTMTDDSREAFEREVDAQPEVVDTVKLGRTAEGWFYRLTIDDESGLAASHDHEAFKGVLMNAAVTPEGVRHQKVFSDYEAFKTHRDLCAAQNIPFKLLNIAADPENPGERDQFGLTEKQHQAISLAFARGYYDSPRTLSTKELANELGISGPSASDLLRRAENQLISQTLGPEQSVTQHTR
ncbi:helix-turn-helix domain-containing protein [Haladaptatus sp. AB643]|uniref:helix-turn-helix domain-containing protein n=1 Tax=Haladaptatus sp. AB643 TaxID=2934174 RepID=UPI00209C0A54|nr:helix-turn-helix domain-containing protein [Haladaptatus sp. AB643]MCO8244129.1 helix-turn-helix domain-containing protein [Haladaptatus sp. AB643]